MKGSVYMKKAETEWKILDVDYEKVDRDLRFLGATCQFSGEKIVTFYDTQDARYQKDDKIIRLTQTDKRMKLTLHTHNSDPTKKEIYNYRMNIKDSATLQEMLMAMMDIKPVTHVVALRTSYKLCDLEIDIDRYPAIPAFMELDTGRIEKEAIVETLSMLGLSGNRVIRGGTEYVHSLYGVDFHEIYKIK